MSCDKQVIFGRPLCLFLVAAGDSVLGGADAANRSIYLSIYLSINLSIHPSIHLSIYLSIYLSIFFLTLPLSGWVVTWFLLGYTVRMLEYTVRTFWSNVGRFLYVFSSIPRKLYTIFQPTFPPIKRYQDSIFKLLTLSTNSVTNVVRTAYFQIQARSSPLKNLWQSLYSK